MTTHSDLVLLGGRLRVRAVQQLDDVDLRAYEDDRLRLLLAVDLEVVSAIAHSIFYQVLPAHHLAQVNIENDAELVASLPAGIDSASGWLADGHDVRVVTVSPISHVLVAVAVLIGTGVPAPAAVTEVFTLTGEVASAEDEVFSSVFETRLGGYRAWHEARRAARQGVLQ